MLHSQNNDTTQHLTNILFIACVARRTRVIFSHVST